MDIAGKCVVITGGASGIGAALARRFHAEGARAIAVADVDEAGLALVAAETGALAVRCNVALESDIQALVARVEAELGSIDIFCSNAGIARLGLLSHIQSATYSVTKHACVAFAEWVAIKYQHLGIRVSVLAPQAVRTPMTDRPDQAVVASVDGMIEPEALAACVVDTMAREEFLILPHPEVRDYLLRKTTDVDRWITSMNRWRQRAGAIRT